MKSSKNRSLNSIYNNNMRQKLDDLFSQSNIVRYLYSERNKARSPSLFLHANPVTSFSLELV
jgi:hypothetical protein